MYGWYVHCTALRGIWDCCEVLLEALLRFRGLLTIEMMLPDLLELRRGCYRKPSLGNPDAEIIEMWLDDALTGM